MFRFLYYHLFLLWRLPAAFFSGVRLTEFNDHECKASIKLNWFNRNPFRSVYFACLSMCAELTTGFPAFHYIQTRGLNVAMLLVGMNAQFEKKALGRITFECSQVGQLYDLLRHLNPEMGASKITLISIGYNSKKEIIARFEFTWSFKYRNNHS